MIFIHDHWREIGNHLDAMSMKNLRKTNKFFNKLYNKDDIEKKRVEERI